VREQEPPGGWEQPIAGARPEARSRRGLWWAAGAATGCLLLAVWVILIAAVVLVVVLASRAL
jgi:hypothetical protein